jgi:hypothetical protein
LAISASSASKEDLKSKITFSSLTLGIIGILRVDSLLRIFLTSEV